MFLNLVPMNSCGKGMLSTTEIHRKPATMQKIKCHIIDYSMQFSITYKFKTRKCTGAIAK